MKGKKIQVIPTVKVDEGVEKPFHPSNILHKHMRIDDEKLDQQMKGLDLRGKITEGIFSSVRNMYQDRKLLEAKLPTV